MALGLMVEGRLRFWKEHWASLTFAYAQTGFFSSTVSPYQTDAVSLAISWVAASRIGASQFHVSAEVGPRVSLLDVTSSQNGTHGQYAALSGLLALGLGAEISPRMVLEMNLGAAIQSATGPVPAEIASGRSFQPASLGGTAKLSVSAFF